MRILNSFVYLPSEQKSAGSAWVFFTSKDEAGNTWFEITFFKNEIKNIFNYLTF